MLRKFSHDGPVQFVVSRDIIWFGLREMLTDFFSQPHRWERQHSINDVPPHTKYYNRAVVIAVEKHVNTLLRVLHYLYVNRESHQKNIILLECECPAGVADLLYAFGVDDVYFDGEDKPPFMEKVPVCPKKTPCMLSPRERLVIIELLTGKRVVDIAYMLDRDVRTISFQKHSALQKLGLSFHQLQLLGSRMI